MVALIVLRLADDQWLSQCGSRRSDGSYKFNNRPRPWRDPPEMDLSMVLGRLPAHEARETAFGVGARAQPGRDAVRHVTVGALRSMGFRVEHTPRRASPKHVSVYWDGPGEWGDKVDNLLHSCCMAGEV